MLRGLLAKAAASATSSASLPRLSNQAVPLLHGLKLPTTPGSGSPGLSSSSIVSAISCFGAHFKFSAVGIQTASITSGISTNEDDYSGDGKGEGKNPCAEYRGSETLDSAEAKSLRPQHPAKTEDLSPQDLFLLDTREAKGLQLFDPAKPEDLTPEDVDKLVSCLQTGSESDYAGAMRILEQTCVRPSPGSVALVLSRLKKNCDAALAFFSWAMKQPNNQLSCQEFHSMVVILVRSRRFEAALLLIRETARSEPSFITSQTLLFLLKMFCVRGQAEKAVTTFDSLSELGCKAGTTEFESLLAFLCRGGKVAEAEKLLLRQENRFPFCTRSFNVVLRGWCEVLVSPRKAKQFWLMMKDRGIQRDVDSYGTMISCLAKSGDADGALQLFEEMKVAGISTDVRVFKGVITAMATANRVKEAIDLIWNMEVEKSMIPGTKTISFVFWRACRCGSVDDAVQLLDKMTKSRVSPLKISKPSPKTLLAIFGELRTGKDIAALAGALKLAKFDLPLHVYTNWIRRLCQLKEYDGLFTIWQKMRLEGPKPDKKTYVTIIHGMYSNGSMKQAQGYYLEMRTRGFNPEPRADLGFLLKRTNCLRN